MIAPNGYSVIYADPPWRYGDKCLHRGGAERHYPTLSVKQIARLNVREISAPDSFLFLWVTNPFIVRGVHSYIAERWGFTLKTIAFVWAKTNGNGEPSTGMGHYTRANPECCFLGVRGHPERAAADVNSLVLSPRLEHSAKPPEVRDRIVRLCGNVPRIELFARETAAGWAAWGNEIAP
jgi:N6-adenosine-specific RNA methylase IME4